MLDEHLLILLRYLHPRPEDVQLVVERLDLALAPRQFGLELGADPLGLREDGRRDREREADRVREVRDDGLAEMRVGQRGEIDRARRRRCRHLERGPQLLDLLQMREQGGLASDLHRQWAHTVPTHDLVLAASRLLLYAREHVGR